ncbi:MAG: LLM class F420-dependent oxidoreductase [Thermomicrobiales bacterium]
MKYGIATPPVDYGMRPDDLAVLVEDMGFESLFFAEHTHIPCGPAALMQTGSLPPYFSHMYDLFVALGIAAGATRTLLLGSGVNLIPEHDPINAAKALASIDVLSGGRFLWGIGAGWIHEELRNMGANPDLRWTMTDEYVQAIRAIWAHDAAEFHGRFVDFDAIWSWPKPLRPQGPPLLIGGNGPRVPERVVAYGDEWFPEDQQTAAELGVRIAAMQAAAGEVGRDPIPVSLFGPKLDLDHLQRLREAGVTRIVFSAPAGDRDAMLATLDALVALREAVEA